MSKSKLRVPNKIWNDKNIKHEGKIIYAYIYSKGFDKKMIDLNVGEIQHLMKIKNVGLRNNLKLLEDNNYLYYDEYSKGMYTIYLRKSQKHS